MDRGSKVITVEIEDVPLMISVLDTYIEGLKEAKEASIEDFNTLITPEKLLDTMSSYDENLVTLTKLREVIIGEASLEELEDL